MHCHLLFSIKHARISAKPACTSAISFDFRECGSSIFLPPVSLPIFQSTFETRHAARPQRTKPIGE